jgi:hypothetical protein
LIPIEKTPGTFKILLPHYNLNESQPAIQQLKGLKTREKVQIEVVKSDLNYVGDSIFCMTTAGYQKRLMQEGAV